MSRTLLLRTRRALRFNALDTLEARALLTASPVALFTNPVISPVAVVSPPVPTSSSDALITASSAASQTGTAPSTSAASAMVSLFNSTSAASASALNVPSATGSDKVASTSGSSGTSVSGPSGFNPSSGTAAAGGNDQQGPLRAELAATEAARGEVVLQIASAEMAIANDKQRITGYTGVLKDIQARIAETTAQEATLAAQISSLATDYSQDGQMVAYYLRGELQALQAQEASLNDSAALYQRAIAAAQQQLEFDPGVKDRLKLRLDQLDQRIKEINEILAGVV